MDPGYKNHSTYGALPSVNGLAVSSEQGRLGWKYYSYRMLVSSLADMLDSKDFELFENTL